MHNISLKNNAYRKFYSNLGRWTYREIEMLIQSTSKCFWEVIMNKLKFEYFFCTQYEQNIKKYVFVIAIYLLMVNGEKI